MKLKVAFIFVAVMLLGLAAWSQQAPKVELSVDYSYAHYGAIDFESQTFEYGQWFGLNGGGAAVVYNFGSKFGLRADFQGYTSDTRTLTIPAGNPFLPQGGSASVSGNLTTYMFGPQFGIRRGHFRPYALGLVGGAYSNVFGNAITALNLTNISKSRSNNAFAADAGVGLDIALNRRFSLRPFEFSYLYTNFDSAAYLTTNQNSWRYLGGAVINFGGKPPVPVTATCSATPATVMVGEPVTVTAAGANFNPKHTLKYAWTASGGKLSSVDTATATVNTTGLSEGKYTASASITDPKGPKKYNVTNCAADFNVNVPHNPPQVTCSASPTSVKPGESSTITANATSPDKSNITAYTYTASGGTVSGSGTTAALDTGSQPSGTITVTVTATDARGLSGTCTTSVDVAAPPPPPPPACANIEDWGQCTFEKNPHKPWRVDNDCRDTLDKLALRLQQQPSGTLAIVGSTNDKEAASKRTSTLGAQRAVNSKNYLTTEGPTKADPNRIHPRQGATEGQVVHFFFVPEGNLCSGQTEQGSPIDESTVHPQSRTGAAPKHSAKPPAQ